MRKLSVVGLLLALAVCGAVTAAPALARNFQCQNQTLGATTVVGNLVVPYGAYCDLNGTHVTGNAEVDPTAGLLSDQGATIDGNVHVAHNGQFAEFNGSTVGGNLQCDQCSVADVDNSAVNGNLDDNALNQGAIIQTSHIGGNLHIHNATDAGFGFQITNNTIGGDLEFDHNTGAADISNNTIAKKLDCNGNTPPPTGGGNTAQQKQGQCAML